MLLMLPDCHLHFTAGVPRRVEYRCQSHVAEVVVKGREPSICVFLLKIISAAILNKLTRGHVT